MKKILFFALLSVLMIGCSQEDLTGVANTSQEQTTLFAMKRLDATTRGAAVNNLLWDKGQTIRIKFLNGTEAEKSRVQQYAAEWLQHAGLEFQYVGTSETADVKIGFNWNGDRVNWSYLGTEAKIVRQNQPSMNFGDLSPLTSIARQQVLVEFGHMLGLLNEHYNPNVSINWDRAMVYEYYQELAGWSAGDIDQFFFANYNTAGLEYTDFDSKSIMVWPIEGYFTLDGFSMSRNYQLSEKDKALIAKLYPKLIMVITLKSNHSGEQNAISLACSTESYSSASLEPNYFYEGSEYFIDFGNGATESTSVDGGLFYIWYSYDSEIVGETQVKVYGDPKAIKTIHALGSSRGTDFVSFDASKLTELTDLLIQNRQLEYLDVSKNSQLRTLHVNGNNLSSINMSSNSKISSLQVGYNPLCNNQSELIKLANSLPDRSGLERGYFDCLSDEAEDTWSWIESICAAKNWGN